MKEIKPYTHRDSADGFLPRDVLDALGDPRHVQQGRLVVFAESAAAAARRLDELKLDLPYGDARRLALATASDVNALKAAGLNRPGGVFAISKRSGAVVEILATPPPHSIERIGTIVRGEFRAVLSDEQRGRYYPVARALAEADSLITEAMVAAAVRKETTMDMVEFDRDSAARKIAAWAHGRIAELVQRNSTPDWLEFFGAVMVRSYNVGVEAGHAAGRHDPLIFDDLGMSNDGVLAVRDSQSDLEDTWVRNGPDGAEWTLHGVSDPVAVTWSYLIEQYGPLIACPVPEVTT